jgi:hypothetical protein
LNDFGVFWPCHTFEWLKIALQKAIKGWSEGAGRQWKTTNEYELTWRGWRRNHLVLVVVLVFVIEDPIVEDEMFVGFA